MLQNRDYTLILDRSGSMSVKDIPGKSRWQVMQETTVALANKCEEFDPDGLTVYTFASGFRKHENCLATKVNQIFKEEEPSGGTNLDKVLEAAFASFFDRKAKGELKENGEIIIIVTDGEPNDKQSVLTLLINASNKLDADSELGILFVQIGAEPSATKYLKILDDDLLKANAKFDIVDVVTSDDMEDRTLTEIIMGAIND